MMSFGKEKMLPLKAAMALMIVADHLALFYGVAFLKPFIELGAPIVSVFFFISGYGLQVSFVQKGDDYLQSFFTRRFLKVILPFVLASVLYGLLLLRKPLLPFSWFVLEILCFYLVFYLSNKFLHGKWTRMMTMTALTALMMFCMILAGFSRAWWVSSLAFPTGVFFAAFEKKLYTLFEAHPSRYWLALGALLAVFLLCYLTGQQYVWTLCYVCIPLIVALVVARLPLAKLNVKAVTFLATLSYEIYLCQGISMSFLHDTLGIRHQALFVLLVYLMTIALAWGLHWLSGLIIKPVPGPPSKTDERNT